MMFGMCCVCTNSTHHRQTTDATHEWTHEQSFICIDIKKDHGIVDNGHTKGVTVIYRGLYEMVVGGYLFDYVMDRGSSST